MPKATVVGRQALLASNAFGVEPSSFSKFFNYVYDVMYNCILLIFIRFE
jgi:hypothetical protein